MFIHWYFTECWNWVEKQVLQIIIQSITVNIYVLRRTIAMDFCGLLQDISRFTKGRVQKLKSAKVWSLTIEGGEGVTQNQSLI